MSESYQDSALARGPAMAAHLTPAARDLLYRQEAREVQRRGRPGHGAAPEHDRPRVEPERGGTRLPAQAGPADGGSTAGEQPEARQAGGRSDPRVCRLEAPS